jgi:hypothetical protein
MNRSTLTTTCLTLACGVLLLSGCRLTDGSSEGSVPPDPPGIMCSDFTSQSYMQCRYYEPPVSPNDYTWGSAG